MELQPKYNAIRVQKMYKQKKSSDSKQRERLTCDPLQARVGTPAAWAMRAEPTLSPKAFIDDAGGPRKTISLLVRASGSSGFSEAWPHPGQTAETPNLTAVCNIKF
jgi:hypothetical protein